MDMSHVRLSDMLSNFNQERLLTNKITRSLDETYIISYDQQSDTIYVSSANHSSIYRLKKLSYITISCNFVDISSFGNMSYEEISTKLYRDLVKNYGYNEENNCWYCTYCGEFMGENNPRQLCGKTYCHNEYLFTENEDLENFSVDKNTDHKDTDSYEDIDKEEDISSSF